MDTEVASLSSYCKRPAVRADIIALSFSNEGFVQIYGEKLDSWVHPDTLHVVFREPP